MFHRPRTENEQTQSGAKTATTPAGNKSETVTQTAPNTTNTTGTASTSPAPQGPAQQAQQTMTMDAPQKPAAAQTAPPQDPKPVPSQTQGFQGLKDKIFDKKQDTTTATEDKTMTDTDDQQNNPQNRTPEMPAQASAFQKPGSGPRVPGAYPGSSYPGGSNTGSVYGAPGMSSSQGTAAETADQRKLVVGRGITMSGEIESCDMLLVEGTVEAALKGASMLQVAESGVFYGTVEIDEATIAGRFEGDLTVNGRLTVKASGSITGSIVYKELAIEAGATLDGKVSPLGGSKFAARGDKGGKKGKAGARNDNGDDGNELPFTGNASA